MRFAVLVILPAGTPLLTGVTHVLAPYGDDHEWDSWELGGAWCGLFHGQESCPLLLVTEQQYAACHSIVTPTAWWGGTRYEPWHSEIAARFPRQVLPPLWWLQHEYPDHLAAIVSCHT